MPDNSANFTYDGTNGPIGTTTVTRAELITALEHLNYASGYNIRAIDELGGSGLVSVDSLGAAAARSIAASDGLQVTDATGISGNPTISVGTPSTFRQAIDDTESNTVTNSVRVSILSTGSSYSVPAPSGGVISQKTIINTQATVLTLFGSVWADTGITTVLVPPGGRVDMVSNLTGKWWVHHPYLEMSAGGIFVSSAQTTEIVTGGNYYEDNSVYELNDGESTPKDFTLGADSRLVYSGKVPIRAQLVCSLSMTTGSAPAVVGFRLVHYDDSTATSIPLTHSLIERKVASGGGGDQSAVTLHGDVILEPNDYVYLSITHTNSAVFVITENAYLYASGMPMLTT